MTLTEVKVTRERQATVSRFTTKHFEKVAEVIRPEYDKSSDSSREAAEAVEQVVVALADEFGEDNSGFLREVFLYQALGTEGARRVTDS